MGDVTYKNGLNGVIKINIDTKLRNDVTENQDYDVCGNDDASNEDNTNDCGDETKTHDVDGGWAWVVLIASCINMALMDVFMVLAGIFQLDFLETFGGSRGFMALIGSIFVCSSGMLGPVTGVLTSRVTPRVTIMSGGALMSLGMMAASFAESRWILLLTYGLINGLGAGLVYTSSATAYTSYFHKYRQIAIGFVMGSPGVGLLTAPYLGRWFLDSYGWRYSMSICGCIAAQICVLGALVFPAPGTTITAPRPQCCVAKRTSSKLSLDKSRKSRTINGTDTSSADKALLGQASTAGQTDDGKEKGRSTFRNQVWRVVGNTQLWIMCANQALLSAGISIDMIHLPAYVVSIGVPFNQYPDIFLVYAVTFITARVGGGFIFNRFNGHLVACMLAFEMGFALVLGLMPLYGVSFEALCVFCFVVGLTYAPAFMLLTPVLIQYIGLEDLSIAFGINMLCGGIGFVIGPPVAGMLYDFQGTYRFSFYLAGGTIGVGALLLFFFLCNCDRGRRHTSTKVTRISS